MINKIKDLDISYKDFIPALSGLIDGELQIEEDEAPIIRMIYDKFVNTTMGIEAIHKPSIFLN